MNHIINEHWNNPSPSLPGVNCLAYANGKVTVFSHEQIYDPGKASFRHFFSPLCDTTIESLLQYEQNLWVQVDPWASLPYQGGKLLGGDGSMGGDGFIALVDGQNKLIWALFFQNTNPIKTLTLSGHRLIAINEHDELQIEVDLTAPTKINILVLTRD